MPGPVIHLQHVSKIYTIGVDRVIALDQINMTINTGEMLAVVGKSGAGKSTLLHIVGTLDQATEGQVILNGTEVSQMPDISASRFRNATIGFVFQMNNLLPEFSALENVMMPGLIAGLNSKEIKQRAADLLRAVDLSARENHRPGELSGGEQQRVAIARALLMAPPILLTDEPTGNLDQKTSHAVQDLLFQLCADFKITMLLVTHDIDLAQRLPGRITMEDGKIIEFVGGGR